MFREKKSIFIRLLKPSVFINTLVSLLSYYLATILKKSFVWGYPPILMIEPTNLCNLKCPLCPSGKGDLKRRKGYLDLDLYKKVIDEIGNKSLMIILWNQGEPFLHKDIIEMIVYAKKYGLFVMISTNANIIPHPEELVRSGLDNLIVSLDGVTQETYNKYRINGNINKVIDNSSALVAAKKKLNLRTPLIKWQFLVMKHNENEIDSLKKMAAKIGVDTVVLKTVQIYEKSDIEEFLPLNDKYRRYKIEGDDFTLRKTIKNRCRRIFTQPVVNCDGEVAICCFDKDNELKIGNIADKSLWELWHSKAFNAVRNTILHDRKKIPICLNCGEGIKLSIDKK